MFTMKTTPTARQVKVKGENIKYSPGVKYLGVYLDKRLTFTKHVNEMTTKTKKKIHALQCMVKRNWGQAPK